MLIAEVCAATGVDVADRVCICLCAAGMSSYEFIVELIKWGLSVVLEQDSISYSEAAAICFNSCFPVSPIHCSMCAVL